MSVATQLGVVRAALESRGCKPRGGNRFQALCPAHDDSSPSLSVGIGKRDAVVLHCFAGCSVHDVMEALDLPISTLFPEDDHYRPGSNRSTTDGSSSLWDTPKNDWGLS